MSYVSQDREDYDLRLNPLNRAVVVLQRQYLDTAELRSHIDRARDAIDAANAARVCSLLSGVSGELSTCGTLLQERIGSLSPSSPPLQPAEGDSQRFWRLFRTDGPDCSGHLEALLSGYVHYARATSDSIAFLEMLGDADSVTLMQRIFDVADRGIWFIELYMEGLALHMDTGRLPEFTPVIDVLVPIEVNRRT